MKINVKSGDSTYLVVIEDINQRPVLARIDNDIFEIWPDNGTNLPTSEAKAKPASISAGPVAGSTNQMRAPIPGVITALCVKIGDQVEPGQELCKLEAMKMNNSIRANRVAKIQSVLITVGQQVKQNEILFEFSDN